MKKFVTGLLAGAILMFSVNAFAAVIFQETPFTLFINGVKVDKPIYADDKGTTYVPLWEITEKFGIDAKLEGSNILLTTPTIDIEAVAEKCKGSCVMIRAYRKDGSGRQGSGFVYDGYIVTANHVIDGTNRIEIYTNDLNTKINGTVVTTNKPFDVAVIKADIDKPSVKLGDSSALKQGDKLFSISSPKATKNVVDYCEFKEIGSFLGNADYVIAESETEKGSSGGAVFNEKGEVVCLVNGDPEGANETTAVPINLVKIILNDLKYIK